MITVCPDRNELEAYALGELADDAIDSIAEHLDSCPECEDTVAMFDDHSDTFARHLQSPLPSNQYADEPELRAAVAAAHAVDPAVISDDKASSSAGKSLDSHSQTQTQLGDYHLLGKLGEGGMGAVFKARHTRLNRIVALKMLPASRVGHLPSIARFSREIEAVGKLNHANIVSAYDAGETDDMHFLVMEFVEGVDLQRLVKQNGPLSVADACEIVRQAAIGLQHAHEHGLVHRDVKPSNLLLSRDGKVKVLDLGLALLHEEQHGHDDMTKTGQVMGTLDYMSPEQATDSHRVDHRTDLYGLGCTLFKLLTGAAPFSGADYQAPAKKIMAHAEHDPPRLSEGADDVPEALESLVARLLAKDPNERPESAAELAKLLEPFTDDSCLEALGGRVVSATSNEDMIAGNSEIAVMLQPQANRHPARRWPRIAIATFAFVMLAAGIIITIRQKGHPDTQVKVPLGSDVTIDRSGDVAVTLPSAAPQPVGNPIAEETGNLLSDALRKRFRIVVGTSRIHSFDESVSLSTVANPAISDAVQFSDTQFQLIGKSEGSTTWDVWHGEEVTIYHVDVLPPNALKPEGQRLDLTKDKSRVMSFDAPVYRIAIANPSVLAVKHHTPIQIELVGKSAGSTTMHIWCGGIVTTYHVVVELPGNSSETTKQSENDTALHQRTVQEAKTAQQEAVVALLVNNVETWAEEAYDDAIKLQMIDPDRGLRDLQDTLDEIKDHPQIPKIPTRNAIRKLQMGIDSMQRWIDMRNKRLDAVVKAIDEAKRLGKTNRRAAAETLWSVGNEHSFLSEVCARNPGVEDVIIEYDTLRQKFDPDHAVLRRLAGESRARDIQEWISEGIDRARTQQQPIERTLLAMEQYFARCRSLAGVIADGQIKRREMDRIDRIAGHFYRSVSFNRFNPVILDSYDGAATAASRMPVPFDFALVMDKGYVIASRRSSTDAPVDIWRSNPPFGTSGVNRPDPQLLEWARAGQVKDPHAPRLVKMPEGVATVDVVALEGETLTLRIDSFGGAKLNEHKSWDVKCKLTTPIRPGDAGSARIEAYQDYRDEGNDRLTRSLFVRLVDQDNLERGQLIYLRTNDYGKTWSAATLVADQTWWGIEGLQPLSFQFSPDHVGCFGFDEKGRSLIYRSADGGKTWTMEHVALKDQYAPVDARRIPVGIMHDVALIYAVVTDEQKKTYRLCRCGIAAEHLRAWLEGVAITGELPLVDGEKIIVRTAGPSNMEAITYTVATEDPKRLETRLAVALDNGRTWKELPLDQPLGGEILATTLHSWPMRICVAAHVFDSQKGAGQLRTVVQEIQLGTIDLPDDVDFGPASPAALESTQQEKTPAPSPFDGLPETPRWTVKNRDVVDRIQFAGPSSSKRWTRVLLYWHKDGPCAVATRGSTNQLLAVWCRDKDGNWACDRRSSGLGHPYLVRMDSGVGAFGYLPSEKWNPGPNSTSWPLEFMGTKELHRFPARVYQPAKGRYAEVIHAKAHGDEIHATLAVFQFEKEDEDRKRVERFVVVQSKDSGEHWEEISSKQPGEPSHLGPHLFGGSSKKLALHFSHEHFGQVFQTFGDWRIGITCTRDGGETWESQVLELSDTFSADAERWPLWVGMLGSDAVVVYLARLNDDAQFFLAQSTDHAKSWRGSSPLSPVLRNEDQLRTSHVVAQDGERFLFAFSEYEKTEDAITPINSVCKVTLDAGKTWETRALPTNVVVSPDATFVISPGGTELIMARGILTQSDDIAASELELISFVPPQNTSAHRPKPNTAESAGNLITGMLAQPDGTVTWVDAKAKIAWIDVGSDYDLSVGAHIVVISPVEGTKTARYKATLVITRVLDKRLSETRIIVEHANQPVETGDGYVIIGSVGNEFADLALQGTENALKNSPKWAAAGKARLAMHQLQSTRYGLQTFVDYKRSLPEKVREFYISQLDKEIARLAPQHTGESPLDKLTDAEAYAVFRIEKELVDITAGFHEYRARKDVDPQRIIDARAWAHGKLKTLTDQLGSRLLRQVNLRAVHQLLMEAHDTIDRLDVE